MKCLLGQLGAMWLMGMLLASPGSAHSWYPRECCSNQDCIPADALVTDIGGNKVVRLGQMRIVIPRDLVLRPSLDDRVHICIYVNEHGRVIPLCVFVPPES